MSTIDHARKFVWIHVPKTAGNSIETGLRLQAKGHKTAKRLVVRTLRCNPAYFAAAFVRHPADRLWSAYNALVQHRRTWAFVEECGSWDVFVDRLPGAYRQLIHTHPMVHFLTMGGRVLVHFVGRFERLEEDYRRLCGILEEPVRPLPHINRSKHGPWQKAYTPGQLRRIEKLYQADYEVFGYA